jgi:WD40 repeat protein
MMVEWHPTAENILLSAGYDNLIIVWNIAKGQAVGAIDCHEDTIYSMSFNRFCLQCWFLSTWFLSNKFAVWPA